MQWVSDPRLLSLNLRVHCFCHRPMLGHLAVTPDVSSENSIIHPRQMPIYVPCGGVEVSSLLEERILDG